MDRPDTPGTATGGLFTSGNPFGGIDSTIIGHEYLNDLTGEMMSIIEGTGQAPTKGAVNQVLLGLIVLIESNINAAIGRELVVVAPSILTLGDFFGIEDLWGVAKADAASGANVTMQRMGLFSLPKKNGEAFLEGESVYWDSALSEATVDQSGSNKKLIGFCQAAASAPASTAPLILTGEATPST